MDKQADNNYVLMKMIKLLVHFRYQLNFVKKHFINSKNKSIKLQDLFNDMEYCSQEYFNLINSNQLFFGSIDKLEEFYKKNLNTYCSFKRALNGESAASSSDAFNSANYENNTITEKNHQLITNNDIDQFCKNQNSINNNFVDDSSSTSSILAGNHCESFMTEGTDNFNDSANSTDINDIHVEYFCSYLNCRFRAKTLAHVKIHEQRRHVEQIQKCFYDGCNQIFKTKEELDSHMSRDHLNAKFKCTAKDCKETFKSEARLRMHFKKIHVTPDNECDQCSKKLSSKKFLRKHMKRMHGLNAKKRKLNKNSENETDTDETEEEEEEEKYNVEDIEKKNDNEMLDEEVVEKSESSSLSIADKANNDKNNDETFFTCTIDGCNEKFLEKSKLNNHVKTTHKEEYLTCKFCDKFCRTRNNLTNHLWLYHEEGEFRCPNEGCDFVSNYRNLVLNHKKLRHRPDRTCPICGDIVPNVKYQRHLTNFHKVRRQACSWPDCGKTFSDHSSLKNHVRIHLNLKRFKCKWNGCNYASEQRFSVITHIRVCHFKLPRTKKKQRELNIATDSMADPYDYLEICREDICI